MRKLLLVILITTVMLGVMMVPAQAAESIVSTNVFADLLGIFNATYESTLPMLPDNMSFYGTGYYFNYYGWSGFGIGAGVNYYFGEVMKEGIYATGGLYYENWFVTGNPWGYSPFGLSLGVGYKYYLSDQWVVDGQYGFGGRNGGFYGGIGYVLK